MQKAIEEWEKSIETINKDFINKITKEFVEISSRVEILESKIINFEKNNEELNLKLKTLNDEKKLKSSSALWESTQTALKEKDLLIDDLKRTNADLKRQIEFGKKNSNYSNNLNNQNVVVKEKEEKEEKKQTNIRVDKIESNIKSDDDVCMNETMNVEKVEEIEIEKVEEMEKVEEAEEIEKVEEAEEIEKVKVKKSKHKKNKDKSKKKVVEKDDEDNLDDLEKELNGIK